MTVKKTIKKAKAPAKEKVECVGAPPNGIANDLSARIEALQGSDADEILSVRRRQSSPVSDADRHAAAPRSAIQHAEGHPLRRALSQGVHHGWGLHQRQGRRHAPVGLPR